MAKHTETNLLSLIVSPDKAYSPSERSKVLSLGHSIHTRTDAVILAGADTFTPFGVTLSASYGRLGAPIFIVSNPGARTREPIRLNLIAIPIVEVTDKFLVYTTLTEDKENNRKAPRRAKASRVDVSHVDTESTRTLTISVYGLHWSIITTPRQHELGANLYFQSIWDCAYYPDAFRPVYSTHPGIFIRQVRVTGDDQYMVSLRYHPTESPPSPPKDLMVKIELHINSLDSEAVILYKRAPSMVPVPGRNCVDVLCPEDVRLIPGEVKHVRISNQYITNHHTGLFIPEVFEDVTVYPKVWNEGESLIASFLSNKDSVSVVGEGYKIGCVYFLKNPFVNRQHGNDEPSQSITLKLDTANKTVSFLGIEIPLDALETLVMDQTATSTAEVTLHCEGRV